VLIKLPARESAKTFACSDQNAGRYPELDTAYALVSTLLECLDAERLKARSRSRVHASPEADCLGGEVQAAALMIAMMACRTVRDLLRGIALT